MIAQTENYLKFRQSRFPGDREWTAKLLHLLAELYRKQGRYKEGELLCLQALEMRKRFLRENHPDVATSLNSLAGFYENQGRYEDAEPLYEQALEIFEHLQGENHFDVAISLNNLASLYRNQGRYEQAEPLYQKALEIFQRLQGKNHSNVAISLNNLAELYRNQGRYEQAELLYQQALEIFKHLQGENHPNVATSLNNLASLYQSQGRYEKAELLYQQALEIFKHLQGDNHPNVATSLNNLAMVYFNQGRYEDAKLLLRKALDTTKHLLGEHHPYVAQSLNNLGLLYCNQGLYEQAEPLLVQGLEGRTRLLGQDHPDVADSLNNLAALLAATSRPKEALAKMKEATEVHDRIISRVFGASSEKDRLRYLDQIRDTFDVFLSLVSQQLADSPEAVQIAFDLVLKRKMLGASASAAFSQAIYSGRYPHLAEEFQQLRQLSDRIFNLTFSPPKADENQTAEQFTAQQTAYKQQLAQLETEYDNLEKQLAAQVPEIRLQEQLQTANRRAVALELPEGSTLVEFVQFRVFDFINNQWQSIAPLFQGGVGGDRVSRYLAFVLPAGQEDAVQMVDLGPAEDIDRLIRMFRQSVGKLDWNLAILSENNPPQPPLERGESLVLLGARRKKKVAPTNNQLSAGIELRDTIINPLKNIIGEFKHWIVAPDGNLNLLPLQILPLDETGQQRLMDDRTITYLSVGRDILRGKVARSRPVAPALILADPDFDLGANPDQNQPIMPTLSGSYFTRAPGTRFLGENVAKKLGVMPYLEREAVEPRLTRGDCPEILLIATHGYFSEEKQPYVNLINTLRQCPESQKQAILTHHGELVNEEFLILLQNNANWFAESGREELANWYQDLVNLVSQMIDPPQPPLQKGGLMTQMIDPDGRPTFTKKGLMNHSLTPPFLRGAGGDQNPISREARHRDRSRLNSPTINNPMMRSGLALAGANLWIKNQQLPDEIGKGFIWAQDIAGLDLWGNELTILSACNTAMGEVKIGEGVFGMRRAFAIAGCKTLVMSLWPVPDKATALLMDRFFDNLHQGLGRGDALQDAQNYIRNITIKDLQKFELGCQVLAELNDKISGKSENYQPLAHPVYWGAWVGQGNIQPFKELKVIKTSANLGV